jgi:hypothetical protein
MDASNPNIVYMLASAVIFLFGMHGKQVLDAQKRADKALDDANARTVAERTRNDELVKEMVVVVERLDREVEDATEVLRDVVEYMRDRAAAPVQAQTRRRYAGRDGP